MVAINVHISDIEPLRPLLDTTAAVTNCWIQMASSYGDTEENLKLAELLDELVDAVLALRRK